MISRRSSAAQADTVAVTVLEAEGRLGVQLCPAIILNSLSSTIDDRFQRKSGNSAVPAAVKLLYSQLGAAASSSGDDPDRGVPDLVLSLVADRDGHLSPQYSTAVERALASLCTKSDVWLISSMAAADPLASAAARVLRDRLPECEGDVEVLHVGVSSLEARAGGRRAQICADTAVNTLLLLSREPTMGARRLAAMRALTAVRLAQPPPALLVGVPVTAGGGGGAREEASPASGSSLPVLLSTAPPERRPLHCALFAGNSLTSLVELCTLLESGVPVLVLEDASPLGALLRRACRSLKVTEAGKQIDGRRFLGWLTDQLRLVDRDSRDDWPNDDDFQPTRDDVDVGGGGGGGGGGVLSPPDDVIRDLDPAAEEEPPLTPALAAELLGQTLALVADSPLLGFLTQSDLSAFPAALMDALLSNGNELDSTARILRLAARLGEGAPFERLASSSADSTFSSPRDMLVCALRGGTGAHQRLRVLARLLRDGRLTSTIDDVATLLSHIVRVTPDRSLFERVVVARLLNGGDARGTNRLVLDAHLARKLDSLLARLSAGSRGLFSLSATDGQPGSEWILAIWLLLLGRSDAALCVASHSAFPVALALILSRVARSLATESAEWSFHEQRLRSAAERFTELATRLLDAAHVEADERAYRTLCAPIGTLRAPVTLPQLAFQTGSTSFLAHESVQRWTHALLYGRLILKRNRSWLLRFVPDGAIYALAAVFIFPIWLWFSRRSYDDSQSSSNGVPSPTAAVLAAARMAPDNAASASAVVRHHHRRPVSSYSVISSRTAASHDIMAVYNAAMGTTVVQNADETAAQSATPQSMLMLSNLRAQDVEASTPSARFPGRQRVAGRRRQTPDSQSSAGISLSAFYSTPIVKFWFSLALRIIFLCCLAAAVSVPGCGRPVLDVFVWLWALLWWADQLWVVRLRLRTTPASTLPWRCLDVIVTALFLGAMLALKFGVHRLLPAEWIRTAYAYRVASALFLLYSCISTLLTYVPMSRTLGPFVVRVKLMVTQDLLHFCALLALLVVGECIALHALVFPDEPPSWAVFRRALSWGALSLVGGGADHTDLEESASCKKHIIYASSFCGAQSGHSQPSCPSQAAPAWIFLFLHLVLAKILLLPLLFALFARTGRRVDQETETIWHAQLYELASDFSLRPALPPPFTPLLLIGALLCRGASTTRRSGKRSPRKCFGCWRSWLACALPMDVDHPDSGLGNRRTTMDDGESEPLQIRAAASSPRLFFNPSVPTANFELTHAFWRRIGHEVWSSHFAEGDSEASVGREETNKSAVPSVFDAIRVEEQKNDKAAILVNEAPNSLQDGAEYASSGVKRLAVSQGQKSWRVPVAFYLPPVHNRPATLFVQDRPLVDAVSFTSLAEVRRQWRSRQWTELSEKLTEIGGPGSQDYGADESMGWRQISCRLSAVESLPLNPAGRTGIAGRGVHARFGANSLVFYVILSGTKVLVRRERGATQGSLPSEWRDASRAEEGILAMARRFAALGDVVAPARPIPVGQTQAPFARLLGGPEFGEPSPDDTDHAWLERVAVALSLGFDHRLTDAERVAHMISSTRPVTDPGANASGLAWIEASNANSQLSPVHANLVRSAVAALLAA